MSNTLIILNVLAGLAVIEGMIILSFTKEIKNILRDVLKNNCLLEKIGLIELFLGILVVFLSLVYYFFYH
jgi:uncharacterized protein YjeT (DUF2065 family)